MDKYAGEMLLLADTLNDAYDILVVSHGWCSWRKGSSQGLRRLVGEAETTWPAQ